MVGNPRVCRHRRPHRPPPRILRRAETFSRHTLISKRARRLDDKAKEGTKLMGGVLKDRRDINSRLRTKRPHGDGRRQAAGANGIKQGIIYPGIDGLSTTRRRTAQRGEP